MVRSIKNSTGHAVCEGPDGPTEEVAGFRIGDRVHYVVDGSRGSVHGLPRVWKSDRVLVEVHWDDHEVSWAATQYLNHDPLREGEQTKAHPRALGARRVP